MVNSIRYWLQATRIAHRDPSTNTLQPTLLGKIVFGKDGDPYLEDEGTIWLLHWLLASNPEEATAIYWFFNHFHKPAFTTSEVATGLTDFAKRELSSRTAVTTLKNDAQIGAAHVLKDTDWHTNHSGRRPGFPAGHARPTGAARHPLMAGGTN